MDIPAHLPIYREPLIAGSSFQTYILHVNALCQFQWDYILDWHAGKQPKIWIFGYRCFQRQESSAEFQEVDQVPFDVPVWDGLIQEIARHASEALYSNAEIVGDVAPVSPGYQAGAAEASKKRYDMRKYREMAHAQFKADQSRLPREV